MKDERMYPAGAVATTRATTCMMVKKKANWKNCPYSGRVLTLGTSSPQA
jgi:hypothetical protein